MQTIEAVSSLFEDIGGIIASCTVYEKIYRLDNCESAQAVIHHLPGLYTHCYGFMATAITYFHKTNISKFHVLFI